MNMMASKQRFKLICTLITLCIFGLQGVVSAETPCNLEINYEMSGYVVVWDCNFDEAFPRIAIEIVSVTGGSGDYTVSPLGSSDAVSNMNFNDGEGFTYFFSETEQDNSNIGFVITDGAGSVCFMDQTLATQLYYIPISTICTQDCPNPIELDIANGTAVGPFSCGLNGLGQSIFTVDVASVTGGAGTYMVESIGAGIISNSIVATPGGFTYTFTQADIDSNTGIGFTVYDADNCDYTTAFEPFETIYPGINITDFCENTCVITAEIATFAGTNDIIYNCDLSGPEITSTITIENIIGGSGTYQYSSNVGSININSNTSPGSLTYAYTQADQDSGQLGVIISDAADGTCVNSIDLNQVILEPVVTVCNICNYFFLLDEDSSGNPVIVCDNDQATIFASISSSLSVPINISSLTGSLSSNMVNINETFSYTFTSEDYNSGQLIIAIGNEFSNCIFVDIASLVEGTTVLDCLNIVGIDAALTSEAVQLYPVPASNVMHIDRPNNLQLDQIQLFSANGQLIAHLNPDMTDVNVSSLQNGMYYLMMEADGQFINKRFAVLH